MNIDFPFLAEQPVWLQATVGLLSLLVVAYLARVVTKYVAMRGLDRAPGVKNIRALRVLLNRRALGRLLKAVPPLVIQFGVVAVPHLHPDAATVIRNLALAVTVLHVTMALVALLDAVFDEYERHRVETGKSVRSIKSFIQLGQLALALVAVVIIISILIDRSPLIMLSGLGAMSAVLMLVFKDTLLSFTAGLQLASNDLLRVGDWIEMPQVNADGAVIDIALHTVKVQNWDKTITTIPTWRLMSESFKNWRGMQESGGRRIKRTLRLDAGSIRFLTPTDIDRLLHIAILQPYLERKLRDVKGTNVELERKLGDLARDPANQRRLTNLGTFRAYISAYLEQHPGIHQEMLRMVRAMEPTAEGVPMEIYCFTATVVWVEYEGIQSDIFDHLLAILPEFGLRLYQKPSGQDVTLGLGSVGGASRLAMREPAVALEDATTGP